MQRSRPRFATLLAVIALSVATLERSIGQRQPAAAADRRANVTGPKTSQPSLPDPQLATSTDETDGTRERLPFASAPSELGFQSGQATRTEPTSYANVAASALAGNQLLADAVRHISEHRSIVANIRHRIHMFGHELVGSGTYQQMDAGQYRLLRLELKIPLDDQITNVTQISDARFLWQQRTMPDGRGGQKTDISKIDLDQLRGTVGGIVGGGSVRRDALMLGQGGLPQLMIDLQRHFAFHNVRAATLHDVPVWITWGQWKPEALSRVFPSDEVGDDFNQRVAKLPMHVPHIATVVLGCDDLLPYQFEYRRRKDASDGRDGLTLLDDAYTESIVTMELFAVEVGGKIDTTQFVFRPGDRFPVDRTREYLQRAMQAD